ncbi:MAG: hypothetical protein MJ252_22315 [archaeon]|nr:hypothetical protein [archaeon]
MDKKAKGTTKATTDNKKQPAAKEASKKDNKKQPAGKTAAKTAAKTEPNENSQPKEIPGQLIVESFPSRNELIQKINEILSKSGQSSDSYKTVNGSNKITFIFKNADLTFNLIKELNVLKASNNLYSNMKISLQFANKQPSTSLSKVQSKYQDLNPNPKRKKIKIDQKNYPVLRSTSVFISDPYIDPAKREYEEYAKGKLKWMNQGGFRISSNLNNDIQLNEIGNYVSLGKYDGKGPSFRSINKERWISEEGFLNSHSPANICEMNVLDIKTANALKKSMKMGGTKKIKGKEVENEKNKTNEDDTKKKGGDKKTKDNNTKGKDTKEAAKGKETSKAKDTKATTKTQGKTKAETDKTTKGGITASKTTKKK